MENVTCKICGKICSTYRGLGGHVRQTHSMSPKEYYDTYLKKNENEGICEVCGKPTNFKSLRAGYVRTHGRPLPCTERRTDKINNFKNTCLKKFGASTPLKLKEVRDKTESSEIRKKAQETYQAKTGKIVWNQGETGKQKWVDGQKERWQNTLRKNNTFNSSRQEDKFYAELIKIIKKSDIERNYNKDERYPFSCDFYIKSLDLFIELNLHWTHGGHQFNKNSKKDVETLTKWKDKSKNSQFYRNAITTWTVRDVEKFKCAKKNKLNYIVLWNKHDVSEFLINIKNNIDKDDTAAK